MKGNTHGCNNTRQAFITPWWSALCARCMMAGSRGPAALLGLRGEGRAAGGARVAARESHRAARVPGHGRDEPACGRIRAARGNGGPITTHSCAPAVRYCGGGDGAACSTVPLCMMKQDSRQVSIRL